MIGTEIPERETVQVPAMSRIAERTEVCVVRRRDEDPAAWAQHSMKLFHGPNYVKHVFNYVNGPQRLEGTVAEGIGKVVKIADDVGAAAWIAVNANRPGIFVDAAADVESSLRHHANCGADALVRAGPPGPAVRIELKADAGVGRGPGGPPHSATAASGIPPVYPQRSQLDRE